MRVGGRNHRAPGFPAAILTALAAQAACLPAEDGPGDVIVRDSAGVVIVENGAGAEEMAAAWRVRGVPALQIGVVEGEGPYQFSRLRGVARLADETLVALDAVTREVRFFDPDGAHRATAGGAGEGPGEFSLPEGPYPLQGDTVAFWDLNLRRFTFFDSRGREVGILTPSPLAGWPMGFLAPGIVVVRSSTAAARPGDPEEIMTNRQVFQVVDLERGGAPDTVAVEGELRLLRWTRNAMMGFTPVPFTVDASGAVGSGRLVVTPGSRRELRIFDSGGRLERIVRVEGELESLDRRRFDAEVERRLARAPDREWERERRRQYAAMPRPPSVPAWSRALVDDVTGGTWVERFRDEHEGPDRLREPSRWTVFDADGAVRATVELPAGFTPHQVTREGLLGVYRDEVDVEYLWMLTVERS